MTPSIRRSIAAARSGSARACAVALAAIAVCLAVDGQVAARPPSAEDERFWMGDSLLTARADSLGERQVRKEVRGILRDAAAICRDTNVAVGHDVERWIHALRWAAILGDEPSLPAMDAIAQIPRHPSNAVAHFRLTYYARWAAYRIRSADLSDEARGEMLCAWLSAESPWQRIFAEDRLANSGVTGVRALREYIARELLPGLAAMDPEPFSEAELEPLRRYFRSVDLLIEAVETTEERALLEEWRGSSEEGKRRLAEDVLATAEK